VTWQPNFRQRSGGVLFWLSGLGGEADGARASAMDLDMSGLRQFAGGDPRAQSWSARAPSGDADVRAGHPRWRRRSRPGHRGRSRSGGSRGGRSTAGTSCDHAYGEEMRNGCLTELSSSVVKGPSYGFDGTPRPEAAAAVVFCERLLVACLFWCDERCAADEAVLVQQHAERARPALIVDENGACWGGTRP